MKVLIGAPGRFHAYSLSEQLQKNGVGYRLVTSYHKKLGLDPAKVKNYSFLNYLNFGSRKLGIDKAIRANSITNKILQNIICREYKKFNPDILHIFGTIALDVFEKAKESKKVKVLDCGSTHPGFSEKIMKEEYSRIGLKYHGKSPEDLKRQDMEFSMSDYVAAPSHFVQRTLIENGIKKEKILVIPVGVDTRRFSGKRTEDGKFRLLFVGNNGIRKGVHYLIQAFSELRLPDAELNIVGRIKEEMAPFIKKYPGNYRFLGHVPEGQIIELYMSSSALVLPSLEEGSSLTTYEAMAAGLPQIISPNTGSWAREGKEALVFPIRDVGSLKEKIQYLYDNPGVGKRMGRSAKSYVKKFTWDRYGENMIKAYKEMLE